MLLIGWLVLLDNICVTHLFIIGRYASFARSDWYTLKGIVGRFHITVSVPWPNDFREIFENVNVRARHREFYEFIYFFYVLKFIDEQILRVPFQIAARSFDHFLPLCFLTVKRKYPSFLAGSLEENFQIFSLSNKLERWKRCVLFKRMNKFKRGCQHPSHKFEIFW